jgi:hypothetical protein
MPSCPIRFSAIVVALVGFAVSQFPVPALFSIRCRADRAQFA